VLSDASVNRCSERATGYDRDNQFFADDFDDLRAAGSLPLSRPHSGMLFLAAWGRTARRARSRAWKGRR
jgi:hypothetical protein